MVLKGCVVLAVGVSWFHFVNSRDRKPVHAIKSQGPPPFLQGLHLRFLEPIQTAIPGGLVQPVNLSGTFRFETATYPFLKYSGTTDQYLLHPSAFGNLDCLLCHQRPHYCYQPVIWDQVGRWRV